MSLFKLPFPGNSPLFSDSSLGPGVETMEKCSLLNSSLTHTQPHAQLDFLMQSRPTLLWMVMSAVSLALPFQSPIKKISHIHGHKLTYLK